MLRDRHLSTWFPLALTLALALSSCRDNTQADARTRLSEYIHSSFEVRGAGDKKTLLGFLTGDAKVRLEAWSDDQFLDAFTGTKRQFLKLDFREVRPLADDRVNITYEVTYLDQKPRTAGSKDQAPGGHNAKITTKKLCELSRVEGKWYITEVRNIRELVEYQDEIAISPIR